MKKLLLIFGCLSAFQFSNAQEIEKPKFKIIGASGQFGFTIINDENPNSLEGFQKLNKDAQPFQLNVSDFEEANRNFSANSGPDFDLMIHLNKKKEDGTTRRLNPEYRIGLSFSHIDLHSSYFTKSDTTRVDTLTSNQSGVVTFIDSINNKYSSFRYSQDLVFLTAGIQISSNPLRQLRFYIGAEASVGYAVFATSNVTRRSDSRYTAENRNSQNPQFPDFSFSSHDRQNKKGFSYRLAVPIGVSLRLSRKLETQLSRCMVFLEMRPSLSYFTVPELSNNLTATNLKGLGFRYDF